MIGASLTDTGENVQKWTRVFSTRRWVILVARTRRKKACPVLDIFAYGKVSSPCLYRLSQFDQIWTQTGFVKFWPSTTNFSDFIIFRNTNLKNINFFIQMENQWSFPLSIIFIVFGIPANMILLFVSLFDRKRTTGNFISLYVLKSLQNCIICEISKHNISWITLLLLRLCGHFAEF